MLYFHRTDDTGLIELTTGQSDRCALDWLCSVLKRLLFPPNCLYLRDARNFAHSEEGNPLWKPRIKATYGCDRRCICPLVHADGLTVA